jgi:hypothetical protein
MAAMVDLSRPIAVPRMAGIGAELPTVQPA